MAKKVLQSGSGFATPMTRIVSRNSLLGERISNG
jgi:hypothetical protein